MKLAMSFVVLCGISLLFIQPAPAAETRRKADQPAAQVPKKALQEMAFLIGQWESEGTMGDKKIKGTYEAQWAPGRHCLVLKASWDLGDSELEASGVSGWDPEKKQLVETWFGSGPKGGTLTIWYSIDKEPSAWIGTTLEKFHDGPAVSGTTRLEKMKDAFHGIGEETVNGEEVKVETMTRKVQPAVNARTAADYLAKQQEYFVGEWNTEIIEGEGAGLEGHLDLPAGPRRQVVP